jgi:hypothetical protein
VEKFVVSRELAEKLKAAGYPQEPWNFYWLDGSLMHNVHDYRNLSDMCTTAPLSDELLEQLPKYIDFKGKRLWLVFEHDAFDARPTVNYFDDNYNLPDGKPPELPSTNDLHTPDAYARMWLWCKEHGYVQ